MSSAMIEDIFQRALKKTSQQIQETPQEQEKSQEIVEEEKRNEKEPEEKEVKVKEAAISAREEELEEELEKEPEKEKPKEESEKELPVSKEASEEDLNKLYETSLKNIEEGKIVAGKVVGIDEEGVLVDVGQKSEGIIPPDEISYRKFKKVEDVVSVGDEVFVFVLSLDDGRGHVVLSKKRADHQKGWLDILKKYKNKEVITATCTDAVRGGLLVDVGLDGFVPASQIEDRPARDLSHYVGTSLRMRVLEIDERRNKVIFSQKAVLEEEAKKNRETLLNNLQKGQICRGKVVRIADFGAFVDLGGIDGLVHRSELSWKRVKDCDEIVRRGDEIEVMVLFVDKDQGKISLSLKRALPDPWETLEERFKVGQTVEGRVTKIAKSYVFVELTDGVEGLIPLSELATERISHPSEVVNRGDQVTVKIMGLKPQERRINLSMKQVVQAQEREEMEDYIKKSKDEGKMTLGDVLKSSQEGGSSEQRALSAEQEAPQAQGSMLQANQ